MSPLLIGLLIFFGLRQSKLELTERATAQKKAEDEKYSHLFLFK